MALGITDAVDNELDLYLIYHHSIMMVSIEWAIVIVYTMTEYSIQAYVQGGHGTGNLAVNFPRQGI